MADGPTPEQQADYLVRKLEQTIRDNRSTKGMSFRTWQTIAREEIINAMRAVEKRHITRDRTISRTLLVGVVALISIGFWGTAVIVDRSFGPIASMVSLVAGGALLFIVAEWGLGHITIGWSKQRREERLTKIEDLDLRIKRMEESLRKKHDRLKDRMEEMGPL